MVEPLSDVEKAILRVREAEELVAQQRERVAQFKKQGQASEASETLLRTLEESLRLTRAHLRRLTTPVIGYRCYLMSGERIHGVQMFECRDDAEVILKASDLLESRPEFQNIEIWEGARLVARVPRRAQDL
jgi:hypothetical protein